MTKEEIRKVLDLALEYYKLEIFGTGKESQPPTQERIDYIYDHMQQFLPSDLDEAARKYGHEEPILPEYYNDGDIPDYERWTAEAFKAGAEWMAGQGWISVDERLPEMDQEVIVLTDEIGTAPIYKIGFGHIVDVERCIDYNGWNRPRVKYWMPCPELPTND